MWVRGEEGREKGTLAQLAIPLKALSWPRPLHVLDADDWSGRGTAGRIRERSSRWGRREASNKEKEDNLFQSSPILGLKADGKLMDLLD